MVKPNQLAAEFLGTFLLILTVALNATNALYGALAIASVLAVAIFSMGPVSGGHFNPAVIIIILHAPDPANGGVYRFPTFRFLGFAFGTRDIVRKPRLAGPASVEDGLFVLRCDSYWLCSDIGFQKADLYKIATI